MDDDRARAETGRRTLRAQPSQGARGRGDPHHPRGRRRVREARAAVLRRQGLHRHAAPGDQGVPRPAGCRSRSCTSTPGTTSTRCSQARDELVAESGVRLVVAKVQDDIDAGRVVETIPSRNPMQTFTLLRAIRENKFDAAFGGARRDEEKARAKERVFSFRDEFGQWDPKAQRPELWNLYNGRHHKGEHIRVVPAVQLDRVRHLVLHRRREDQAAVDLLRAPAPGLRARRHAAGRPQVPAAAQGREGRREDRAVPHRRRRHLHRLRRIDWRAPSPR